MYQKQDSPKMWALAACLKLKKKQDHGQLNVQRKGDILLFIVPSLRTNVLKNDQIK